MDRYKLSFSSATSTGSRERNQDVFFADGFLSSSEITEDQYYSNEEFSDGLLHVFVVCDGVGMFPNSGPAAEAAICAIKEKQDEYNQTCEDKSINSVRHWAEEALIAARDAIMNYCSENHKKGSSTIVLIGVLNNNYIMVNTGDSSAFLIDNESITELSVRHNMATLKKMLGAVPVKEEERVLLHHLGENELVFEEKHGSISGTEVFLICSDGISNAFDEKELCKRVKEEKDASFFVTYAQKYPNADNCTCQVIRLIASAD